MDLSAKITECQTAAELTALENLCVLNERAQEMVFERKLEIVCRVAEWRIENERLGLAADVTDTWTPEQRERFLLDWNVDGPLLPFGNDGKCPFNTRVRGEHSSQ